MFEGHRHTSQQQWQWPSFSLSLSGCVNFWKTKAKEFFSPIDIFFFNSTDLSFRHTYLHKKKTNPIYFHSAIFYISHNIWAFYIEMYIFTYYLQQIWHVFICFFPTILHHENVFLVHLHLQVKAHHKSCDDVSIIWMICFTRRNVVWLYYI